MEQLKIKKRVSKSTLTRHKDKISTNLERSDFDEIDLFKTKTKQISDDFKGIFESIFLSCPADKLDEFILESEEIYDSIDEINLELNRALSRLTLKGQGPTTAVRENNCNASEIKLPVLSLPTFSGKIEEWIAFKDLFQASVHENKSISNAMKLQYLKASCKNDALKIIQSIAISDANYEIAIQLLEERYSHKRELVNALIKKLINQPHINESAQAILNLVDVTNECTRSLAVLDHEEYKVEGLSEAIIVYMIVDKLDKTTRGWWERELKKDELGTLNQLLTFLQNQARTLQNTKHKEFKRDSNVKLLVTETKDVCSFCKLDHSLIKCTKFNSLSVQRRINFVKFNNICFNCLSSLHHVKFCKSSHKCRICHKSHNTLLHIARSTSNRNQECDQRSDSLSPESKPFFPRAINNSQEGNGKSRVDSQTIETQLCAGMTHRSEENGQWGSTSNKEVLLCTALIKVLDSSGEFQLCRALLDPGAQANFITEACATVLRLPRKKGRVAVSCLGSIATHTNGEVKLEIASHFGSEIKFKGSAFVMSKIVGNLPHSTVDPTIQENFRDLVLADPTFYKSGPIDILLGVDIALAVLKGEVSNRGKGLPLAVCSEFGWIISGTVNFSGCMKSVMVNNIECGIEDLISKFWELENVPNLKQHLTKEEKSCELHFQNTHSRDDNGRYIVKLPFRDSCDRLGESKQQAVQRFLSLERRFSTRPELSQQYHDFINEYILLGHMEKIPKQEAQRDSSDVFYLPHHAVLKDSSLTTKLRVVFDASAKSSSGLSLNDVLMVGPRVQQELFHILLRFRTFPIALSADVEKMFRQVRMEAEDANYQRILWRESRGKEIEEYRLITVTYGTSSAPFLSTRAIQQLATDEEKNFPTASPVAQKDFYVDDLLSGAASVEEATELTKNLTRLMGRGGFLLRKWISNVPKVLESISDEQKGVEHSLVIKDYESI